MKNNYHGEDTTIIESIENQDRIREDRDYYYRTAGLVGSASFCVVLPKQYAINLGVGKGDFLKVSQQQDKIVIQKA
jgi:hypothetical protein